MNRFRLLALACILLMNSATAQEETASMSCAKGRVQQQKMHAKISVADPAEDQYDMLHVKMNLNLTNTSVANSGDVTTTARVVAAAMPAYVFELNNQLSVDSVKINGQLRTVSTNGNVRTVSLPAALTQNTVFTAQVFYHGTISSGSAFFSTGIRNQSSPSWGNTVTYTMSEPYESRDWWPTKQSLTDKIDSADMWITVPSNLKAGSNGLLKATTPMPNNKTRYEWKTKYPIDYYLLSVAVASYVDYSFYAPLPNSNDSVLVQNYIYDNPQTLPFFKTRIDSIRQMIYYLSQLYGRYPFWQEKYGNCMVPLTGGMEHQTMTSQGNFGTTLTVHELGHQWFGDNVTCGSWKDIWLNEGFASYTEYLYVEHFWPVSQAYAYMLDKHNSVLANDTSSVYVNDTTSTNRIFDGTFTYDKGASIVHTLRFVFGNDSLFFQTLRDYQTQFAGKTALTSDFQTLAEQKLGRNLDTFFQQWIYSAGHPIYSATWNQVGNWVSVKLDQTTSHPSVSLFHTPVELQLFSGLGDTIIKVENNQPSQIYTFYWNKPMLSLSIDPNDWLLNEFGQITKDISLNAAGLAAAKPYVHPNPSNSSWQVRNLADESRLQLTDVSGRLIWTGSASGNTTIPATELPTGVYLLRVSAAGTTETIKLIKQ
jgi:aminopeptidase N